MKALIIGASGILGSQIVGFLSKDDIMSYISEEKGKINP